MKHKLILEVNIATKQYRLWPTSGSAAEQLVNEHPEKLCTPARAAKGDKAREALVRNRQVQINAVLNGRGQTAFGRYWFYVPAGATPDQIAACVDRADILSLLQTIDWAQVDTARLKRILRLATGTADVEGHTRSLLASLK